MSTAKSPPLVSIVLPTHNGSAFLQAALESCVEQTYANWELIVVDDASTDETPAVIQRFVEQDARIRAIRHPQNIRLPGALNSGFAVARGEYLTWTSDDNKYRPHALAEMVQFLEAHPDTGMVYTDYSIIGKHDELISAIQVRAINYLPEANFVGGCFMYRRSVAETIGEYSSDLFLAEDWDYWFRVSSRFHVAPLHRDLYLYRKHDGSLTTQRSRDIETSVCRVLERNLPAIVWHNQELRARVLVRLAIGAADRGDFSRTYPYLFQALASQPRILLKIPPVLWLKGVLPPPLYSRGRALWARFASLDANLRRSD